MVSAGRPAAVECSLPQPWGLSLRDFRKTRPGLFEGSQKVQTQRFLLPAWQNNCMFTYVVWGTFIRSRFRASWSCCRVFRANNWRADGGHCRRAVPCCLLTREGILQDPVDSPGFVRRAEILPLWRKIPFFPSASFFEIGFAQSPSQEVCLCWEGTGQMQALEFGRA